MLEKNGSEIIGQSAGTRPLLSSWKEIARYLQIDVRTCQRWENSFGLPVHRIGQSARSRVLAYPDELDRWRSQTYKSKHEEGAVPEDVPRSRPARRKRVAFLIVPAAAMVILGSVIAVDRTPDGFRIQGSRLVITNKFGLRLWDFETSLPDLQKTAFYRMRFQEKRYLSPAEGELSRFPLLIIRDLDGDGKKEILFAPETISGQGIGVLYLLDGRGRLVWEFQTGQGVRVGTRDYPPDFVINLIDVQDFNGDGRLEILVGSHCWNESPMRIVLLDLKKNILGDFWHFGQLADFSLTPVDKNGRSQLVFVGQNNEYDCPTLVVLDPLHMRGCSPQNPASAFAGMDKGTELCYIRFPNTEVDLLLSPRGEFSLIKTQGNGHYLLQTRGSLRLDFDPSFQSPQVIPTDRFVLDYMEAYRAKRIDSPFERQAFIAAYSRQIRYFDGRDWVSHPTMANPGPRPQSVPQRPL
jgi:hypothetical protein